MSAMAVKEKKWYRKLISCFRRQKKSDEDVDSAKSLEISAPFKNEYEMRLHEENLLYRKSDCNDHPVLNIGIGLNASDLCGPTSNYRYHTDYINSGLDLYIHPGFEEVTEEIYYDEPIIDGLPATLWLECIEPTLDILSSLSILRHRKSNLVKKKPRPANSDSHYSRHGDSETGLVELLSRRLIAALNGSLNEIQHTDIVHNANISRHHQTRRRHGRSLFNINQSANHDTDDDVSGSPRESSSYVQIDNLNIHEGESDDDDDDDDVAAGRRDSNSSVQLDNLNSDTAARESDDDDGVSAGPQESSSSVEQDNLNPDTLEVVHQDAEEEDDLVLEDLESLDEWELPAKFNPISNQSARDSEIDTNVEEEVENDIDNNTATGDNCGVQHLSSTSQNKSKRKRSLKTNPHLYFWKPEIRQFEKLELRNYPLNTLMLVNCGVKYFFQIDDEENEKELLNRLTYLSRMDFFTRRLIMSESEAIINYTPTGTHEITSKEIINAEKFLKLKGISPNYGASLLKGTTEESNNQIPTQNRGFFRRKINDVRRFFSGTP